MPTFHTKTIESILEPVAVQVSILIVYYEDAESGRALPDLTHPVSNVSAAVANLMRVGHDTLRQSDDAKLRTDMPLALARVETAATCLREAAQCLKGGATNSNSVSGRRKLVEGSRGILQGTTAVLVTYDLSEVRRIVRVCEAAITCLCGEAAHVRSFDAAAKFIQNFTPIMKQMVGEVERRAHDLTSVDDANGLHTHLGTIRHIVPLLVTAFKVFIVAQDDEQIHPEGPQKALANKSALIEEMTRTIQSIIRILLAATNVTFVNGVLKTAQEDDSTFHTVFAPILAAMRANLQLAQPWLSGLVELDSPHSEECKRAAKMMLSEAQKLASQCLANPASNSIVDGQNSRKLAEQILARASQSDRLLDSYIIAGSAAATSGNADALREAKARGQEVLAEMQGLLKVCTLVTPSDAVASGGELHASNNADLPPLMHTLLENVHKWTSSTAPISASSTAVTIGQESCSKLVANGRHVDKQFPLPEFMSQPVGSPPLFSSQINQQSMSAAAQKLDNLLAETRIATQQQRGEKDIAQLKSQLNRAAHEMHSLWQIHVLAQVVDTFVDEFGPLKELVEITTSAPGEDGEDASWHRNQNFEQALARFNEAYSHLSAVTELVVMNCSDPAEASELNQLRLQFDQFRTQLLPQSAQLLFAYNNSVRDNNKTGNEVTGAPEPITEHFAKLHQEFQRRLQLLRNHVDNAVDTSAFIHGQQAAIDRDHRGAAASAAISESQDNKLEGDDVSFSAADLVDGSSRIARRTTRIIQKATGELENSEDVKFTESVRQSVDNLKTKITPMIMQTKRVVTDGGRGISEWHQKNAELFDAVDEVRSIIDTYCPSSLSLVAAGDMTSLHGNDVTTPAQHTATKGDSATGDKLAANGNGNAEAASAVTSEMAQLRVKTHDEVTSLADRMSSSTETDEADEDLTMTSPPADDQPILQAAHQLHQEAIQWSSKDNDIVAAAKRIAAKVAKLNRLVRREEEGNIREMIAVAMDIYTQSNHFVSLAVKLANECTDKRIKNNLLQMVNRIPTIATQLKILSTVKATMISASDNTEQEISAATAGGADGAQDKLTANQTDTENEEEEEATESLVGIVTNLMETIKLSVNAAEAASIKLRVDAGIRIRWIRR